jgi:hypothetical protein
VPVNPAGSVRGPRHVVKSGQTPDRSVEHIVIVRDDKFDAI